MIMQLVVLLCIASCAIAQDNICRALALGGGGDRGAYEAGAIKALVELQSPEKVRYDVGK
jgi:predicted patatin/cPLA2 family phospholipase